MRNALLLSCMTLSCVALSACGIDINRSATGEVVREDRVVDAFTEVALLGSLDLEVDVGGETAVAVVCGSEVLTDVITEVEDGTLVVRLRSGAIWAPLGQCEVHARTPGLVAATLNGSGTLRVDNADGDFERILLEGSGDVDVAGEAVGLLDAQLVGSGTLTVDGIASTALDVGLTGSGDVRLSGQTGMATMALDGSGSIEALDLTAEDATIGLSGSGDIDLTVTGTADVVVTGSGTVHLAGNPETDIDIRGSGDVNVD